MIHVRRVEKVYPRQRGLLEVLRRPFQRTTGVRALDGIDLEVERGEVFGLLGPNGAGKTTLIKILANVVLPTAGEVTVAGRGVRDDPIGMRREIGYVPSDERSFFWRLSGLQNLRFFSTLYEIPPREAERRIAAFLDRFAVAGISRRRFGSYSSGERKVFSLIRGLLHRPSVVVLDEPTNNLDPPAAHSLMTYFREDVKRDGGTVLWATHRLEEVREVCDRVMLIDKGAVRFLGSVAEFSRITEAGGDLEAENLLEVFERRLAQNDRR